MARSAGRPPLFEKSHDIHVTLPESDVAYIDRVAAFYRLKRAAVVRLMVRRHIACMISPLALPPLFDAHENDAAA